MVQYLHFRILEFPLTRWIMEMDGEICDDHEVL